MSWFQIVVFSISIFCFVMTILVYRKTGLAYRKIEATNMRLIKRMEESRSERPRDIMEELAFQQAKIAIQENMTEERMDRAFGPDSTGKRILFYRAGQPKN
jgi:hypothetical protein